MVALGAGKRGFTVDVYPHNHRVGAGVLERQDRTRGIKDSVGHNGSLVTTRIPTPPFELDDRCAQNRGDQRLRLPRALMRRHPNGRQYDTRATLPGLQRFAGSFHAAIRAIIPDRLAKRWNHPQSLVSMRHDMGIHQIARALELTRLDRPILSTERIHSFVIHLSSERGIIAASARCISTSRTGCGIKDARSECVKRHDQYEVKFLSLASKLV